MVTSGSALLVRQRRGISRGENVRIRSGFERVTFAFCSVHACATPVLEGMKVHTNLDIADTKCRVSRCRGTPGGRPNYNRRARSCSHVQLSRCGCASIRSQRVNHVCRETQWTNAWLTENVASKQERKNIPRPTGRSSSKSEIAGFCGTQSGPVSENVPRDPNIGSRLLDGGCPILWVKYRLYLSVVNRAKQPRCEILIMYMEWHRGSKKNLRAQEQICANNLFSHTLN